MIKPRPPCAAVLRTLRGIKLAPWRFRSGLQRAKWQVAKAPVWGEPLLRGRTPKGEPNILHCGSVMDAASPVGEGHSGKLESTARRYSGELPSCSARYRK